jgi:chitin disaccharide deacetylase
MLSVMENYNATKLIVNADDFGLSKAVTDAIIDCHRDGIVTSTTIMSNMPFAEYAASRANDYPRLSVGLHLNLTQGKPISAAGAVDNLVDAEGYFLDSSTQSKNLQYNIKAQDQVYIELKAQLKRALDFGLKISHFDSHNGIQKRQAVTDAIIKLHNLYEIRAARTQKGLYWTAENAKFYYKLKKILLNLKKFRKQYARTLNHAILEKSGLHTPNRMISPYYLVPYLADPKKQFIQCLKSLGTGIFELYLHPGYYDEKSTDSEAFKKVRESDARIARDVDVKRCIKEYKIKLISFNEL